MFAQPSRFVETEYSCAEALADNISMISRETMILILLFAISVKSLID